IMSVDDVSRGYERSVRSGDFIIDLDSDGEIRGVEVQNISRILGVDREQLQNVSDVELQMISHEEKTQVTVRLEIEEQRTTLAAQLNQPDLSRA
ncbi:MAG: hypothetical protein ABEJ66_00495, partial [Candidatus Nanohaloarchaea archaeon]